MTAADSLLLHGRGRVAETRNDRARGSAQGSRGVSIPALISSQAPATTRPSLRAVEIGPAGLPRAKCQRSASPENGGEGKQTLQGDRGHRRNRGGRSDRHVVNVVRHVGRAPGPTRRAGIELAGMVSPPDGSQAI
jgi:hypothetical protein